MPTTNKLPEGSTWDKFVLKNVTEDTTITVTFAEDSNDNNVPDKYENFTVSAEAGEGGSVDPETSIVAFGDSAEITISANDGYAVDSIVIGDTTYINNPNYGIAKIVDGSAISQAVSDPEIDTIELASSVSVSGGVQIDKPFTIDGKDYTVTQDSTGKTFTLTKDSTVSNITIESTADNTEWHSSYGIQFYTGSHTVSNVTLTGGNAGIIVNGANVTLDGTVDVSGNTFGGIEVSKGTAEGLSAGILNIAGATVVNTTESYGKPTIWIDGNTDSEGVVTGAVWFTIVEIEHDGSMQ